MKYNFWKSHLRYDLSQCDGKNLTLRFFIFFFMKSHNFFCRIYSNVESTKKKSNKLAFKFKHSKRDRNVFLLNKLSRHQAFLFIYATTGSCNSSTSTYHNLLVLWIWTSTLRTFHPKIFYQFSILYNPRTIELSTFLLSFLLVDFAFYYFSKIFIKCSTTYSCNHETKVFLRNYFHLTINVSRLYLILCCNSQRIKHWTCLKRF